MASPLQFGFESEHIFGVSLFKKDIGQLLARWTSVSREVDAKIRDQIKTGTFPVRLQAQDWIGGDINWLLDIIAPDKKTTTSIIANFRQVVKGGNLRLHPIVTKLVDEETLAKMGGGEDGG